MTVSEYLQAIDDPDRKRDCKAIMAMMKELTQKRPKIWQGGIVGYGRYDYCYPTGRQGSWMLTGFSSRKKEISLVIMSGFIPHKSLLKKLGPHRIGKSCLYIKNLESIDFAVLKKIVAASLKKGPPKA